jgi:multiple sugar transport system permease protein
MSTTTSPEKVDPQVRTPRRARGRSHARPRWVGWLYVAPTAILVALLFVLPILLVFKMSASDWPLFKGEQGWNFPANYPKAIDHRYFWDSIRFTLKYTVLATVLLLGLGLSLAMLVQQATRWTAFLRTSFLIPSALGLASASLLFYALYSPQSSPLLPILHWFGVSEDFSFLGTSNAALWSTTVLIVWRYAGFYMLILMVGLQRIPADAYEAAVIDGASSWQIFTRITLPLLRPSLAMATVLCVTGSLLAFDQFYILTKGSQGTFTVVQVIYDLAFTKHNLGYAAALSVMVLGALIVINILQIKVLRSEDD